MGTIEKMEILRRLESERDALKDSKRELGYAIAAEEKVLRQIEGKIRENNIRLIVLDEMEEMEIKSLMRRMRENP